MSRNTSPVVTTATARTEVAVAEALQVQIMNLVDGEPLGLDGGMDGPELAINDVDGDFIGHGRAGAYFTMLLSNGKTVRVTVAEEVL